MLYVYSYPRKKPLRCFDLSKTPLDELVETAIALHNHQKSGTVWFGYLDGWMLTPREEVLLRKVIRKFDCILVTQYPLSLSHAWKNEINTVFTEDVNGNGSTNSNNYGGSLQYGSSV
jgi:hypothetical protein